MRLDDQLQLGITNLWRTRLRAVLTTLGVAIGIGALVSMVSFGTGMQKNVVQSFRENDLFTSLHVTSYKVNVEGNVEEMIRSFREEGKSLDNKALQKIQTLPGVEIAFPEIRFPVKVRLFNKEAVTNLRALPSAMVRYKPFNHLPFGKFFTTDTVFSVVISPDVLKKLKIVLRNPKHPAKISFEDSLRGVRSFPPDSIIGKKIEIVTNVVDVSSLMQNFPYRISPQARTTFCEAATPFTIVSVRSNPGGFGANRFESGVIIPIKTAEKVPRLGFSSVWELLGKQRKSNDYTSLYVRVKAIKDVEPVAKKIKAMGFGVISITDQLKEIRKGFIILDTALGAIGTIALLVAALGIINTMVMSILERTREIGIMKAIGGSEGEIKGIFLVEAGTIGLVGGIFGLALGWIVTRIANIVANFCVARQGGFHVEFFYIPVWLIFGALAFSLFVSLIAGLYPAARAARVDPIESLRHD